MAVIGKVDSLWRYPVKSMRGEELDTAFVGFSGVHGDRLFAFKRSTGPKGFPYLTGREHGALLLHRARFRHPERAATPTNLEDAESIAPGITPLSGDPVDLAVDVETPAGQVFAVDDPALVSNLEEHLGEPDSLTLLRSDRSMTDCRPISVFSVQTARQLGEEVGEAVDTRRFRANIYIDLVPATGFGEDACVGRRLRVGSKAVIAVLERDPRCKMITLDPDTAEANPEIMRTVSGTHDGYAGVYGAVLVEGLVRMGDEIELLD